MLLLIQYTLIFASVLALVALGGCFSEHSGVINIGLEGIMVMGALGGALAMKFVPAGVPAIVMFLLVVLASLLMGVLFSLLLGVAAINFNADQTLVGTALNLMGTAAGSRCHRKSHQRGREPGQRILHDRIPESKTGISGKYRRF